MVNAIVLHDTGGKTAESALSWFEDEKSRVSSHYVVDKDGTVYRVVPEELVAWHAGESSLFNEIGVNSLSIGIELVDDSDIDRYPDLQFASLIELCTDICFRYQVPLNRVVGHCHIATPRGRKVDPGPDFPWFDFLVCLGANVGEKLAKGDKP
jgi:N-acetylmuramoyl-L-alanine amidase